MSVGIDDDGATRIATERDRLRLVLRLRLELPFLLPLLQGSVKRLRFRQHSGRGRLVAEQDLEKAGIAIARVGAAQLAIIALANDQISAHGGCPLGGNAFGGQARDRHDPASADRNALPDRPAGRDQLSRLNSPLHSAGGVGLRHRNGLCFPWRERSGTARIGVRLCLCPQGEQLGLSRFLEGRLPGFRLLRRGQFIGSHDLLLCGPGGDLFLLALDRGLRFRGRLCISRDQDRLLWCGCLRHGGCGYAQSGAEAQ